ncbi:MAG TPA: chitobiase/beta-hexosaminidase C-terminal domain-containing protein, partial [Terriglobales bacterium]
MRLRALAFILGCLSVANANAQYRTVIDKEVGSLYQKPNGFSYSVYGAYVGSPAGTLDPDAIHVIMARADKFSPNDETSTKGFPYSALRQYEAKEVAAGRAPFFITATYAGKKRPVLFSWSLKLKNNVPTAPSSMWEYAVNAQDPRFIKFWVSRFIKGILWQPNYSRPNVWFQLDQSAFNWGLYGVLDDSNHFVAGVPWDAPFPRTPDAYFASVANFFSQLKSIAPDVKTMPNIGTMSDPSKFTTVFANVPGVIHEDIYGWHGRLTAYTRNSWYQQNFTFFPWLAAQNRVSIFRGLIPSGDFNALVTAFSTYSLLKGPNSFFAPGSVTSSGSFNTNPSQWAGMKALLGNPRSVLRSIQQTGQPAGYRLYWRDFDGGTVYLNWTGVTQTIALDSRYKHYDPRGNVITKLVIPDGAGTFQTVLRETVPVATPRIVPRSASRFTSPLSVAMAGDTTGSAVYYTLDGSTPTTSSRLYTGPLNVASNTLVRARAYHGTNPSWSSTASFAVTGSSPIVQFVSSAETGPAGAYYPILSLTGIPAGTVTVSYMVQQPNGSTTSGQVSFLRGQTYRYFPITVSGARN